HVIGDWYHAVSAYLEQHRQWGLALAHDERRRQLDPDDAVILFRIAVIHEFRAEPQAQSVRTSLQTTDRMRVGIDPESEELRQASDLFARAVALAPALAEARLRWGHVLSATGHDLEAIQALTTARTAFADARLRYYADMFLGRAYASQGDRSAAAASYER